jgi:hypothetical protein
MDAAVMLTALFAAMALRRVHMSDEDLELAEMACRSLAARYRRGSERQRDPLVRDGFVRSAERLERIAGRMKAFRNGPR